MDYYNPDKKGVTRKCDAFFCIKRIKKCEKNVISTFQNQQNRKNIEQK